jgi:hypothetical protein
MNISDLKKGNHIIFECISGSHSYGLNTPTSDIDIKGIFVLPKEMYFTWEYIPQINDETNDTVYYELGRFIELLSKNNPNIMEMLAVPKDKILVQHPLFELLKTEDFLSKKCKDTFAGYAMTQIRKARGLNKKIMNPVDKEKKSILDFCYVPYLQGSISLDYFLGAKNISQNNCGLSKIPNMKDLFAIYYDENNTHNFNGILKYVNSLDITLSSIPKGLKPIGYLSFNKDGYSKYCKDYKEYWDWVDKRNEARYENTISHGKNYDTKNMMHTFRLLSMAEEILKDGKINVHRIDRDFLLKIKSGGFEYDDLILMANEKIANINSLYMDSKLPENPDLEMAKELAFRMRKEYYG